MCGGGSTALQDALFLSEVCRHVTVIHRRAAFRGDPILVDALRKRENVSFALEAEVMALTGRDGALEALTMRHLDGRLETLAVSGLFEAVGQMPQEVLSRQLGLADEGGFLCAGEDCRTAADGVFAAGDCRAKSVRQLTTACADGAVAALVACDWCAHMS